MSDVMLLDLPGGFFEVENSSIISNTRAGKLTSLSVFMAYLLDKAIKLILLATSYLQSEVYEVWMYLVLQWQPWFPYGY